MIKTRKALLVERITKYLPEPNDPAMQHSLDLADVTELARILNKLRKSKAATAAELRTRYTLRKAREAADLREKEFTRKRLNAPLARFKRAVRAAVSAVFSGAQ